MNNIIMGVYQTIGALRKKIGDQFGLDVSEFKLFTKSNTAGLIDHDEDDTQIIQFGYSGPFIIQRIQANSSKDEYHPKNILANNSECIDLLFKLLSEDLDSGS